MLQAKILVVGAPHQYENLSRRLQTEDNLMADFEETKALEALASTIHPSRYDVIVYFAGAKMDIGGLITKDVFHDMSSPVIFIKDNLTVNQTVDLMNAGAGGVVSPADTDRLVALINRTLGEVVSSQAPASLYKDIVDSQSEFICRYDADLRLRYANQAYCDWQRLPLDELIGTSIIEKIPREDRDKALEHVRLLTPEQPIATSRHNSIASDGTVQTIEWTDRAVIDADGNIIEYQGVGRDVTAREKQAQELENYRVHVDAVMDTMQDALMTITLPERETVFVSQAFESVFGYPYKNFVDDPKYFMQIVHPDDLEAAIEAQQTCLREGFVKFDHRVIWPDGQVRWLHRRAWINYDEKGQPVRVNDSARDITDRIETERALAASEELHRAILSTIADAVFITDDEGQFTFICPNTQFIFGYSHDEVVSMETMQKLTGHVAFDLSQLKQDKEIANIEHRIVDKWGVHHDLLINVKDISIGEGTILYSCRDVTEHKHAQKKFEVMFRTNPALVGLSSMETGEYVEVNDAFYEILGFDRNEVIGVKAVDVLKIDPEWRSITIRKLREQGYVRDEETVIIAKDGTPVPVLLSAEVIQIHGEAYNFTSAIDITDRKNAEDALLQSERRYRQMFESVDLPKLITDPHTARILDANPAAIEFYGYPLETLKTMTMLQIIVAEPDVIVEKMQEILAGEGHFCQFEQRLANGAIREVDGYPSVIQYGSQDAIYCTYIDVTERNRNRIALEDVNQYLEQQVKERTQSLALSKNRIEALFSHSADGITLLDAEMKIEQTNYAFDEMFNIEKDSYVGRSLLDLVGENQHVSLASHFPDIVRLHQTRRVELEFLRTDGTTFEGEISIAPINQSDNPVENIVCIIRDVTERKQFDRERRERQRLLRQLADNYPAYVSIIEEDLTIGFTAGYEFKRLGLDPEQFVGTTLDAVFGDQADRVRSHYERAFEGIQQSFELKSRGQYQHYRVVPLSDEDGNIPRILAVVENITERRNAENAVAEERNLLRTVIDAVPDFIYVTDREHRVVLNNIAHALSLGFTPDEVVGKTVFELFPEDMANKFFSDDKSLFETENPIINREERSLGSDGQEIWALTTKIPLQNLTGDVIGLVGITHDVTEMKRNAEALRKSEARYRLIAENVSDVIVKYTIQGGKSVCTYVSPSVSSLLGYDVDELVGHFTSDFVHESDIAKTGRAAAESLANGGATFRLIHRALHKDGHFIWTESSNTLILNELGEFTGGISVLRDITERKRTEDKLSRVSERLQLAIHAGSVGIWDWDIKNDILIWDEQMFEIYGIDASHFTGTVAFWETSLHPDDAQRAQEDVEAALQGEKTFDTDFRIRTPAEETRYVRAYGTVYHDADGTPLRMIGVNLDITDQKIAEVTLAKSEERLRLFIEATPVATLICNSNKEIVLINEATESLFQYKRSELIGQSIQLLVPEDFRDQHESHMTGFIDGDRERYSKVEISGRRKNGEIFVADIQLRRIKIESETLIMALVLDVSQRKEAEASLVKSLEKEKGLAELRSRFVSTASHQFRTPLAAILASTETLAKLRDRLTEQQIDDRLDRIQSQVNRMKALMEDVLELSRMQSDQIQYKPETSDLSTLCREVIDDFAYQSDYKDRIIFSGSKKPIVAKFDPHLMHHVVSNLIHNALKYSDDEVYVELLQAEHEIIFTVRDKGIGVSESDIGSLFIPFSRAENVGSVEGTGLGLSIVNQAVDAHGGTIDVKSNLGEGTVFTVRIPYRSEGDGTSG